MGQVPQSVDFLFNGVKKASSLGRNDEFAAV